MSKTDKTAPSFKELYESKKSIFKKAEVFEIEYTPERLIAREEVNSIFGKIISFLKSRIVQHIFIFGGHGSGKTAYAKYIEKQIKDLIEDNKLSFKIEYINCRFFRDLWETPAHLYSEKKSNLEPPGILIEKLNKDLVIILDEIDEAQDPSDFFYFISRFQEIQSKNKNKIMLILISNKNEWDKTLDSATRSSLCLRKIEFKKYNRTQIKDILKQRINEGLKDNTIISDEIINQIVIKTIENGSDLRISLRAIRMVISHIEDIGGNINDKEINNIYEEAIKEIQLERIGSLENSKFMILYAIMNSPSENSRDIYKAYLELSNKSQVKPWGYTRFVHYTNELENQDFIDIYKGKKEEDGQKNIVVNKLKLKIKRGVIKDEFENRKIDFTKYH